MTDQEMRELIRETMDLQYEADTYATDEPTRAVAHEPASSAELARLKQHLRSRGLPLPPSYAQFLRIHNGIERFVPSMLDLSLRSVAEVIDMEEDDRKLQPITPTFRFIVGAGDDTATSVGFIPDSADTAGEMKMVMLNESGEPTHYDDFVDFLRDQHSYYAGIVRVSRADRQDLKDD
jgi:hypothetical protein